MRRMRGGMIWCPEGGSMCGRVMPTHGGVMWRGSVAALSATVAIPATEGTRNNGRSKEGKQESRKAGKKERKERRK